MSRVPCIFNTSCFQEADACLSCSGEGLGWISPSSSQAVQGRLSDSETLRLLKALCGRFWNESSAYQYCTRVGEFSSRLEVWLALRSPGEDGHLLVDTRGAVESALEYDASLCCSAPPHTNRVSFSCSYAELPFPFLKPLSDWHKRCSSISPGA